jgi:hypothetical protein
VRKINRLENLVGNPEIIKEFKIPPFKENL